ncbi:hypothetical protein UVI_02054900 [Ustilaginoidea virens]|uniref:Uncharacterized protein n=1 Tax=Ustilaginoidea virens TaxID=1159556 RepID=A0A1B5L7K5_USTVR|nr:hypothetical protein UVI_02054900 [Ustilaginoidea virens]
MRDFQGIAKVVKGPKYILVIHFPIGQGRTQIYRQVVCRLPKELYDVKLHCLNAEVRGTDVEKGATGYMNKVARVFSVIPTYFQPCLGTVSIQGSLREEGPRTLCVHESERVAYGYVANLQVDFDWCAVLYMVSVKARLRGSIVGAFLPGLALEDSPGTM